jgi:hypothetical protein
MVKKKKNKGTTYRYKTKRWFETLGYWTDYLEKNQRLFISGKIIFIKKDVAGADGISMNGKEIIFWQSKFNAEQLSNHIPEAIREFAKFPYPNAENIKLWIVAWKYRQRLPLIIDAKTSKEVGPIYKKDSEIIL